MSQRLLSFVEGHHQVLSGSNLLDATFQSATLTRQQRLIAMDEPNGHVGRRLCRDKMTTLVRREGTGVNGRVCSGLLTVDGDVQGAPTLTVTCNIIVTYERRVPFG